MVEDTGTLDISSMREHAKMCAKKFKANWIDLGRVMYSIWKDKMYRNWGYQTFEAYTRKEIGIRKQTSLKLLRSYCFLEKEESRYLKDQSFDSPEAAAVPTYEAVDVLRRAKNNKFLDSSDYVKLRKNVLQDGKEVKEVRRDLTALMRQRQELEPEEAWAQKKEIHIKRLLSTLKSLKKESESLKVLPGSVLSDIAHLIERLDQEL